MLCLSVPAMYLLIITAKITAKKLPLTGIKPLTLGLSVVLTPCVYSLVLSHLSYLGKCYLRDLTLLLFVQQLTFGLGGTERI